MSGPLEHQPVFSGPINLSALPSPAFVLDLTLLRRNCALLRRVQDEAGCSVILALKAFSPPKAFPYIRHFLAGTAASSLHEAKLGRDYFDKEVHVYSPAYSDQDLEELLPIADHLTFNSLSQWKRHQEKVRASGRAIRCGLRINPELSVSQIPKYDPCCAQSRFGVRASELGSRLPEGITGLHFHTLCEQNVEPLERTLAVVEREFGHLLAEAQWVNFGGGHHITRSDYKVRQLVKVVRDFRSRYGVKVYLEPGEAVALNCGALVTTVLDVVNRGEESFAILDTSATNHLPDVLEIPYQPDVVGAVPMKDDDTQTPAGHPYRYQLGGNTCLSCDVFGSYAFAKPLVPGQRLVFPNQAIYTMVKTTTFNGLRLPALAFYSSWDQSVEIVREYGYEAYLDRLS